MKYALERTSSMRSRAREKAGKPSVPDEVREALRTRAKNRCELCGASEFDVRCDPHHRLSRKQGGSDELSNLLFLCRKHHDYVHTHPEESRQNGWILSPYAKQQRRTTTEI